MPRSPVPVNGRSSAGAAPTTAAIDQANGMYVPNWDVTSILRVDPTANGTMTLRQQPCPTCGASTVNNRNVVMVSGTPVEVSNLPANIFADANGYLLIDFGVGCTGTIQAKK